MEHPFWTLPVVVNSILGWGLKQSDGRSSIRVESRSHRIAPSVIIAAHHREVLEPARKVFAKHLRRSRIDVLDSPGAVRDYLWFSLGLHNGNASTSRS